MDRVGTKRVAHHHRRCYIHRMPSIETNSIREKETGYDHVQKGQCTVSVKMQQPLVHTA